MERRTFLSLAAYSLSFLLLRKADAQPATKSSVNQPKPVAVLDARSQKIEILEGQLVQLPNQPAAGQEISIKYLGSNRNPARIISEHHEICHSLGALILNEPSSFSLHFDEVKSDWYLEHHSHWA